MSVLAITAALLLAPAPLAATRVQTQPEISSQSDDPVRLINLGASYERAGKIETARQYYMAAVASRNPVEVRLANGDWVDSRQAARNALRSLDQTRKLAVR